MHCPPPWQDVCVMPAGMEAWDLGHASFVAAVRFHYRYVYHAHSDEGAWLAKNWTKKKDCVTGRLYYESDVTGRKQWNRPHWRPGKPEDEDAEATIFKIEKDMAAGFVKHKKKHDTITTAEAIATAVGADLPMIEVMDFNGKQHFCFEFISGNVNNPGNIVEPTGTGMH